MGNKMLSIFILIATLALHTSADNSGNPNPQTWNVGDAKGWAPGVDFTAWTARDFLVGDKLVFKYDAGKYNVIEVDQKSFTDCTVPADKKPLTSGEDTISLDKGGTKYFICGTENGKYCKNDNMKMRLSLPDQYKSAGPTGPKEYIVGDDKGWGLGVDYDAWVKDKEIMVGDTLVFKYPVGTQNVYTVHKEIYETCTIPPNPPLTTGEDRFTLPGQGELGFMSSVDDNCQKGVKVMVKIGCPFNKKKVQGGRKLVPN